MAETERFAPTSSRILAWIAVAAGLIVAVTTLVENGRGGLAVAFGGLFFALLSWAAGIRPRIMVDPETLTLRNMASSTAIPLASIGEMAVRQVFAVRVGEKRYVSPALGHTLRRTVRGDIPNKAAESYPAFVEERIRHLAGEARERAGVRMGSAEQDALASGVRREVAWPLVAGLLALAAAFVVAAVL